MGRESRTKARASSMAEHGKALVRKKWASRLFAFLLTFIIWILGFIFGASATLAVCTWTQGCHL